MHVHRNGIGVALIGAVAVIGLCSIALPALAADRDLGGLTTPNLSTTPTVATSNLQRQGAADIVSVGVGNFNLLATQPAGGTLTTQPAGGMGARGGGVDCCDPDKTPEGEPCGDDTNGGCNLDPPQFGSIECGEGICGSGWAEGGTRDTDWFLISVPDLGSGSTLVTATVESEFPSALFIVGGIAACAPVVLGDIGCGDDCTSINQASARVVPGDYVIFVAPGDCLGGGIFEGIPCGTGNSYTVTVTCEDNAPEVCDPPCPKGEECQDGVCVEVGCDCCFPHDGVGCDDPECEALVCDFDPFCCDIGWDLQCSDEAADLCECCGGGGEGEGPPLCDCDQCEEACPISNGDVVVGDTSADCDSDGSASCGLSTDSPDVWYLLTAECDGEAHAETCGSSYDTVLSVHTGCPGDAGNEIVCNDDFCGLQSGVDFDIVAGQDYWIRVSGFSGQSGDFTLTVDKVCDEVCDPPCEGCDTCQDGVCVSGNNDDCECRIPIFDGLTPFSTIGATTDGPGFTPPCDKFAGNMVEDIWYNYTATCTGEVTVSTCNDGDPGSGDADYDSWLAAYLGIDCPADNANIVGCDDDFAGCGLNSSFMTFDAAEGTAYKIRVGGFIGSGTGTLFVGCEAGCDPPDCDDGDQCTDDFCVDGVCENTDNGECCEGKTGPNGEQCAGDVNGDGEVNPLDSGAILARFGLDPCNEENCQYDVNCDGVINPLDSGFVLARFGQCQERDICKICEGLGACCTADKTPEGEPCGDDTNGGCNVDPPEFGSIECGEGICGSGWAEDGTRDTDWFLISVPDLGSGSTLVTATVESEFPSALFIVGGIAACAPVVLGDIGCGDDCTSINQASARVVPGDYVIFVAPGDCLGGGIFDGIPCGTGNSYTVTVTCEDNAPEVCDPPCPKGEECQGGVCVPEVCNCCFPHDGVGCDDPECEALVCDFDPFCCDIGWDLQCSDEAIDLCECCGGAPPETPVNDDCADAVDLFDGVTAYSTEGATSAGPDLPPECDKFGVTLNQDIWYHYAATCTGVVSVSTCNDANYDTMLAAYEGTGCPPINDDIVGCQDDTAGCGGNTTTMLFDASSGTEYLVRVGGFSTFEGMGNLTVSCTP